MTYIFYFFGIFAFIYEMTGVTKTKKMTALMRGIKNNEKVNELQNFVILFMFLYLIWIAVGLFTSQWILFLAILLLSFIPKANNVIRFIDSLITAAIIMFIIINKYHLHINVKDWLF